MYVVNDICHCLAMNAVHDCYFSKIVEYYHNHIKQAVNYLNELPLLFNGVVISNQFVRQVVKRKQKLLTN